MKSLRKVIVFFGLAMVCQGAMAHDPNACPDLTGVYVSKDQSEDRVNVTVSKIPSGLQYTFSMNNNDNIFIADGLTISQQDEWITWKASCENSKLIVSFSRSEIEVATLTIWQINSNGDLQNTFEQRSGTQNYIWVKQP